MQKITKDTPTQIKQISSKLRNSCVENRQLHKFGYNIHKLCYRSKAESASGLDLKSSCLEYLNLICDLLKNISLGKEGYFYIFGSGDCDYAMGDVSNQDNTIEEVTPKKCMDVITEQKKKNSKGGRSDTVKIKKILVEFHCCLLH